MQTHLSQEFADTPQGDEAAAILRKCVHCGFCNATCPTYQVLGDELDGPRGRIYLIKQVLEGHAPTRSTQVHLDRCLTCLNCETTCPSGVEYGHLVEIGRELVEERVARPAGEKTLRWVLREGLTSPLFSPAMKAGKALRGILPDVLKAKIPHSNPGHVDDFKSRTAPRSHLRKVLMLRGCVQPAMLPNIDAAAIRVLDAASIEVVHAAGTGCCGALRTHLNDGKGGLHDMRRNIDVWYPLVSGGDIEAIVSSASACSLAIKEYAHSLKQDPLYAEKAALISSLAKDLSELLPDMLAALAGSVRAASAGRVAFHAPCTLQHGQRLRGGVETYLRQLGFDVAAGIRDGHLCCGSAGTYSVTQPEIAKQLRDRKLSNLGAVDPRCIVSANVGCIAQLQSGTSTPVRHWVELLDEALP